MGHIDELNRELERKNLVGYWTVRPGGVYEYQEPHSSFEPCIWRWADLYDGLNKAGEALSLEQSFRRFIAFRTPNRKGTSNTISLGAQLVKPGETPAAHRHTMAAFRFVIQGGGAHTTVDGEPFPLESGDLITTPSGTWHDHVNDSSHPVIWLDGNDSPMLKYFEVGFHEPYSQAHQAQVNPIDCSNVTGLPFYIAVDKGYYLDEGIDLRIIRVQGSHTVATLLTARYLISGC